MLGLTMTPAAEAKAAAPGSEAVRAAGATGDSDGDRDGGGGSGVSGEDQCTQLIMTIRREEFGLGTPAEEAARRTQRQSPPAAPAAGSAAGSDGGGDATVMAKQEARLARALQRLSGELYGDALHWMAELIQNADDNRYAAGVTPAIEFVARGGTVLVLNNERGFSAADVRALCDVGNSTKAIARAVATPNGGGSGGDGGGLGAAGGAAGGEGKGTTGEKGLGFKSVFAVTDAPRLFSRGFRPAPASFASGRFCRRPCPALAFALPSHHPCSPRVRALNLAAPRTRLRGLACGAP